MEKGEERIIVILSCVILVFLDYSTFRNNAFFKSVCDIHPFIHPYVLFTHESTLGAGTGTCLVHFLLFSVEALP